MWVGVISGQHTSTAVCDVAIDCDVRSSLARVLIACSLAC
jgi:hypothetical protein